MLCARQTQWKYSQSISPWHRPPFLSPCRSSYPRAWHWCRWLVSDLDTIALCKTDTVLPGSQAWKGAGWCSSENICLPHACQKCRQVDVLDKNVHLQKLNAAHLDPRPSSAEIGVCRNSSEEACGVNRTYALTGKKTSGVLSLPAKCTGWAPGLCMQLPEVYKPRLPIYLLGAHPGTSPQHY